MKKNHFLCFIIVLLVLIPTPASAIHLRETTITEQLDTWVEHTEPKYRQLTNEESKRMYQTLSDMSRKVGQLEQLAELYPDQDFKKLAQRLEVYHDYFAEAISHARVQVKGDIRSFEASVCKATNKLTISPVFFEESNDLIFTSVMLHEMVHVRQSRFTQFLTKVAEREAYVEEWIFMRMFEERTDGNVDPQLLQRYHELAYAMYQYGYLEGTWPSDLSAFKEELNAFERQIMNKLSTVDLVGFQPRAANFSEILRITDAGVETALGINGEDPVDDLAETENGWIIDMSEQGHQVLEGEFESFFLEYPIVDRHNAEERPEFKVLIPEAGTLEIKVEYYNPEWQLAKEAPSSVSTASFWGYFDGMGTVLSGAQNEWRRHDFATPLNVDIQRDDQDSYPYYKSFSFTPDSTAARRTSEGDVQPSTQFMADRVLFFPGQFKVEVMFTPDDEPLPDDGLKTGKPKYGAANTTMVIGDRNISVDGATIPMDVAPFIEGGRTFVPVRFLANALGVEDDGISYGPSGAVQWVKLAREDVTVDIGIGSDTLTVTDNETGDVKTIEMDTAAMIRNGRTFLPFRFIAEAFDAEVGYQTDAEGYVTSVEFMQ